jgi:hypothetical protein
MSPVRNVEAAGWRKNSPLSHHQLKAALQFPPKAVHPGAAEAGTDQTGRAPVGDFFSMALFSISYKST